MDRLLRKQPLLELILDLLQRCERTLLVEVPARCAAYADRADHIGSDAHRHAATLAAVVWLARLRETFLSVRIPTFVVES